MILLELSLFFLFVTRPVKQRANFTARFCPWNNDNNNNTKDENNWPIGITNWVGVGVWSVQVEFAATIRICRFVRSLQWFCLMIIMRCLHYASFSVFSSLYIVYLALGIVVFVVVCMATNKERASWMENKDNLAVQVHFSPCAHRVALYLTLILRQLSWQNKSKN